LVIVLFLPRVGWSLGGVRVIFASSLAPFSFAFRWVFYSRCNKVGLGHSRFILVYRFNDFSFFFPPPLGSTVGLGSVCFFSFRVFLPFSRVAESRWAFGCPYRSVFPALALFSMRVGKPCLSTTGCPWRRFFFFQVSYSAFWRRFFHFPTMGFVFLRVLGHFPFLDVVDFSQPSKAGERRSFHARWFSPSLLRLPLFPVVGRSENVVFLGANISPFLWSFQLWGNFR